MSSEQNERGSKENEAEEVSRELVITGSDSPELLELVEEALNNMPFFVVEEIAIPRVGGISFGRYTIRGSLRLDIPAYFKGSICFISQNR
jgi:hypothetical protein